MSTIAGCQCRFHSLLSNSRHLPIPKRLQSENLGIRRAKIDYQSRYPTMIAGGYGPKHPPTIEAANIDTPMLRILYIIGTADGVFTTCTTTS